MTDAKKPFWRLGVQELQALGATFRRLRAEGKNKEEIRRELKLSTQELRSLEEFVRAEDVELAANRDPLDLYLAYKEKMEHLYKSLEDYVSLAVKEGSAKTRSVIPTARRAQADILERIVKIGQELGVIYRAPKASVVLNANVESEEVAKELEARRKRIAELESKIKRPLLSSGYRFTQVPGQKNEKIVELKPKEKKQPKRRIKRRRPGR